MSTLPNNHLNTIEACRYCPMCRQSCPSEFISYRESDTPRGRAIILQSVYRSGEEFNPSRIEAIYNCFVCGSCKSWCAGAEIGHYDIPELMKFARRDIVEKNMAPEIVVSMKNSLLANENQYNIDKSQSFTSNITEQKADVLYYLGPEVNFRNKEIAEAVIKILKHLQSNFTMLRNEPDSGKILDLLGYRKEAKEKAGKLYVKIKATGCKLLVVSDPLAYDAFKTDYPEWGFAFEPGIKIMHVAEYLAENIKSGSLKLAATRDKITLADSEFLGRFNNVFDAPREVIKSSAGAGFEELKWNREKLLSTGEAALTFNDKIFSQGQMLGEKIAVLVNDLKAKKVITLSATAKQNISKATDAEVLDIAEFAAQLIG
jgi:Fe-S oxidoreductase